MLSLMSHVKVKTVVEQNKIDGRANQPPLIDLIRFVMFAKMGKVVHISKYTLKLELFERIISREIYSNSIFQHKAPINSFFSGPETQNCLTRLS